MDKIKRSEQLIEFSKSFKKVGAKTLATKINEDKSISIFDKVRYKRIVENLDKGSMNVINLDSSFIDYAFEKMMEGKNPVKKNYKDILTKIGQDWGQESNLYNNILDIFVDYGDGGDIERLTDPEGIKMLKLELTNHDLIDEFEDYFVNEGMAGGGGTVNIDNGIYNHEKDIMKQQKTQDLFENAEIGDKWSVYSKHDGGKLLDIEKFANVFVYWTYEPSEINKDLFGEIGLEGSDELSIEDGIGLLNSLKSNEFVSIEGKIDEGTARVPVDVISAVMTAENFDKEDIDAVIEKVGNDFEINNILSALVEVINTSDGERLCLEIEKKLKVNEKADDPHYTRITWGEEEIWDLGEPASEFARKYANTLVDIFFTNDNKAIITKREANLIFHGKSAKNDGMNLKDVKFVYSAPDDMFMKPEDFKKLLNSIHYGTNPKLVPITVDENDEAVEKGVSFDSKKQDIEKKNSLAKNLKDIVAKVHNEWDDISVRLAWAMAFGHFKDYSVSMRDELSEYLQKNATDENLMAHFKINESDKKYDIDTLGEIFIEPVIDNLLTSDKTEFFRVNKLGDICSIIKQGEEFVVSTVNMNLNESITDRGGMMLLSYDIKGDLNTAMDYIVQIIYNGIKFTYQQENDEGYLTDDEKHLYTEHDTVYKTVVDYIRDHIGSWKNQHGLSYKGGKKIYETGEWEDSEETRAWIQEMTDDMQKIVDQTSGKSKLINVKGFDMYQGPYATMKINGRKYKVWQAAATEDDFQDEKHYWIEDYPVDNTKSENTKDGFEGSVDELIMVINGEIK